MYQDIDPEIASLLFEVKKNQLKMVRRRGYNISREEGILNLTLPQFLKTYVPFAKQQNRSFRSVMTNVYENDVGGRLLVYYADVPSGTTQLGKNEVGCAISSMEKYKLHDAVIITAKQLSPSASKHVASLVSENIQIFLEDEMSYDPTEHFLVPKHIPLSPDEAREFLDTNGISIDQMPILRSDDIIIKNLGLRGGRIVKIERDNMFGSVERSGNVENMIFKSVTYKAVKDV